MAATIIDGRAIAAQVWSETQAAAGRRAQRGGAVPRLAVVHVGDDAASASYLRQIGRSFRANGLELLDEALPDGISQAQLEEALRKFNAAPETHGILLQAPLPAGMSLERAVE